VRWRSRAAPTSTRQARTAERSWSPAGTPRRAGPLEETPDGLEPRSERVEVPGSHSQVPGGRPGGRHRRTSIEGRPTPLESRRLHRRPGRIRHHGPGLPDRQPEPASHRRSAGGAERLPASSVRSAETGDLERVGLGIFPGQSRPRKRPWE
jgi:hypothetical protein